MAKHPKRPRDPNQLAKQIVDLVTMDEAEREEAIRRAPKKGAATSPAKKT
jgi:hypothetical protein